MSSFPAGLPNLGSLTLAGANAIQSAINRMGLGVTGNVYYVDPVNGLDVNSGLSPKSAVQTLAAGYNLMTSGNNDVLVLEGNGTSTGSARTSATFTWAKNACHLIGVCAPSMVSQRARIAPLATAAAFANFFVVSGNGCLFQNLSFFQGFTAGVAAEICLTVSGQSNAFINCDIEGMGDATGATDAGSRCVLLSAGENYFGHCNIGLDTVIRTGANATIEISSSAARNVFENCTFLSWSSDGLQYVLLAAAANALDRWVLIKCCEAINSVNSTGGTALAAFAHMVASCGGILAFDSGSGLYGFTAIGDATTKGQTYVSGGTATNGVKGIVAT
jgi:hypothetical protein